MDINRWIYISMHGMDESITDKQEYISQEFTCLFLLICNLFTVICNAIKLNSLFAIKSSVVKNNHRLVDLI